MRKSRPTKTNSFPEDLLSAIHKAERVLLCAHVSPDGDTIGSNLALQNALRKMGKQAQAVCADPVPELLMFLRGAGEIKKPDQLKGTTFDLAIAVDVSDRLRLGDCAPLFFATRKTIQVDHHGTNPGYADINVVAEDASATGVLIYELIHELGVPLDSDIAQCLYTAIATDTGNFCFDNTTSDAFQVAGELMSCGLPIAKLTRHLFRERSREQVLLLSRALSTLTFYHGGQLTGMQLTLKDLEDCGAKPEHAESIVNYGMDIAGVKMTFLAREVDGGTKFSLRAAEGYNVAKIASQFGGGGHDLAAGCTMNASLPGSAGIMSAAMEKSLMENEA
jgi:phosphoesterase RecJ-like protein